jgi:hypothetical protein
MSPGGFDSVATGFGGVVAAPVGGCVVLVDGVLTWDVGAVDGVDAAEPELPELLQALANPVSVTTASGTTISCLIFMELTLGRSR